MNYKGEGLYQHYQGEIYKVTGLRRGNFEEVHYDGTTIVDYETESGEKFCIPLVDFDGQIDLAQSPKEAEDLGFAEVYASRPIPRFKKIEV